MKKYCEMTREELLAEHKVVKDIYRDYKEKALSLDMSRGKPSPQQLDICVGMMDVLNSEVPLKSEDGFDCRNYGVLGGIPEAKELFSKVLEVDPDQIIIYGNSSLNVMFDFVSRSYSRGVMGHTPWCKLPQVKFLCVVPGYDRHFRICEYFGIDMINVPMLEDGPDMDLIEKLVSSDDLIKGIWCVPKYSNPTGNSYSDEVVRRFARLKPAAPDFRIYWDNAYTVHHFYDEPNRDHLIEIINECAKAGNPDLVYKFSSTSKISFPGSGIAMVSASPNNLKDIKACLTVQTIGYDKLNQLRHVRYFKTIDGIMAHMKKHADIMRPRFEATENILEEGLGGLGIGEWTNPKGGYFISFNSLPGCAKDIVSAAREAGVQLTPAGASYPYGRDPEDRNIRLAPSYPNLDEIDKAMKLFTVCVKLVSLEKLLRDAGEPCVKE